MPPKNDFVDANSVNVPFRPGAPGVLNVTALRDRLQAKPRANKNPMAPNEFALQMLRFPFRQVFGDPDNSQGLQFYEFDKFVATVALPEWRKQVLKNIKEPRL